MWSLVMLDRQSLISGGIRYELLVLEKVVLKVRGSLALGVYHRCSEYCWYVCTSSNVVVVYTACTIHCLLHPFCILMCSRNVLE